MDDGDGSGAGLRYKNDYGAKAEKNYTPNIMIPGKFTTYTGSKTFQFVPEDKNILTTKLNNPWDISNKPGASKDNFSQKMNLAKE